MDKILKILGPHTLALSNKETFNDTGETSQR